MSGDVFSGDPDAWWASLPRERRAQIHRWIEQPAGTAEAPGQVAFFDICDHPAPKGPHR